MTGISPLALPDDDRKVVEWTKGAGGGEVYSEIEAGIVNDTTSALRALAHAFLHETNHTLWS